MDTQPPIDPSSFDINQHPPPDDSIAVEIIAYVTDPKRVGFQVLTNYENVYWRALVGRDAWALYEVLRSFCHRGNNTCSPSIRTLMDILGVTDRRQLTGRVTKTRGKARQYPGFIDMLQAHKLALAEETGSGPNLRYKFHVNLHPSLLNDSQMEKLPKSLQERHANLIERVAQDSYQFDLLAEQVPIKQTKRTKPEQSARGKEGGGTAPVPLAPHHPSLAPHQSPPGTTPPKQQPYNNTHESTTNIANIASIYQNDGVVALISHGVTKATAQKLVKNYGQIPVLHQTDFLEFQMIVQDKQIKRPGGYLKKAVEQDYAEPADYTPDWRLLLQQQETEHGELLQQREVLSVETQEYQNQAQAVLDAIANAYDPDGTAAAIWQKTYADLKPRLLGNTLPHGTLSGVFAASRLVLISDDQTVVVVSDDHIDTWHRPPLMPLVNRLLAQHIAIDNLQFLSISEAQDQWENYEAT